MPQGENNRVPSLLDIVDTSSVEDFDNQAPTGFGSQSGSDSQGMSKVAAQGNSGETGMAGFMSGAGGGMGLAGDDAAILASMEKTATDERPVRNPAEIQKGKDSERHIPGDNLAARDALITSKVVTRPHGDLPETRNPELDEFGHRRLKAGDEAYAIAEDIANQVLLKNGDVDDAIVMAEGNETVIKMLENNWVLWEEDYMHQTERGASQAPSFGAQVIVNTPRGQTITGRLTGEHEDGRVDVTDESGAVYTFPASFITTALSAEEKKPKTKVKRDESGIPTNLKGTELSMQDLPVEDGDVKDALYGEDKEGKKGTDDELDDYYEERRKLVEKYASRGRASNERATAKFGAEDAQAESRPKDAGEAAKSDLAKRRASKQAKFGKGDTVTVKGAGKGTIVSAPMHLLNDPEIHYLIQIGTEKRAYRENEILDRGRSREQIRRTPSDPKSPTIPVKEQDPVKKKSKAKGSNPTSMTEQSLESKDLYLPGSDTWLAAYKKKSEAELQNFVKQKLAADPIVESMEPGDRVIVYFDPSDEGKSGTIENAEGHGQSFFARFKIVLDDGSSFQYYPYSPEQQHIMVVPEDVEEVSPATTPPPVPVQRTPGGPPPIPDVQRAASIGAKVKTIVGSGIVRNAFPDENLVEIHFDDGAVDIVKAADITEIL